MKLHLYMSAFAAALVVGCGFPDSTAQVSSPMPGDADDLGQTGDALSTDAAKKWFPLAEGNEWTLTGLHTTRTIKAEYQDGDVVYVTGLRDDPTWFGYSASYPTNLYVWNEGAQSWGYHTRFGYASKSWSIDPINGICDQYVAKREQTGVTVTTPAGKFTNVRVISYIVHPPATAKCPIKIGPASIAYAPSVGPVQITMMDGDVLSLTHATVGTKEYKAKYVVQVAADKASYENTPNTIRCITAPCPSNEVTATATFTLTVTNKTTTAQTLKFTNNRHFDVELTDAEGKVVAALSDKPMNFISPSQIALGAGKSITFSGTLNLKDRDGVQLSGIYTARAFLTANNLGISDSVTTLVHVTLAQ